MRGARVLLAIVVIVALGFVAWRFIGQGPAPATDRTIAIYYAKTDGDALGMWRVSLSPKATDTTSMAFYATAQVLAGPPPGTDAIRFPAGTFARSVHVSGATATVDLTGTIAQPQRGSLTESGEFKALTWTLTALPGISTVAITLDGKRVPTLPGGHLEIDEPLARSNW